MYNHYLQNKCPPEEKPCSPPSHASRDTWDEKSRHHDRCDTQKRETDGNSLVSLFGRLLGSDSKGGLGKLLDDNTLIVLLILFFLLKDEDGIDHDLLILAGIFLLIGL